MTSGVTGGSEGSPTLPRASQACGSIQVAGGGGVQPSQPFTTVSKKFVPPLSPAPRARAASLPVVLGGAENLISVRMAAELLGVSTATLYKLCERGELPHIRVSNAIRIAPADLAAFIADSRSGSSAGSAILRV